jgi:hypothetical protein
MCPSSWTPSIAPNGDDQNVYLVVDDFGGDCRILHEADVEETDRKTVIRDLMSGQYNDPVRVVTFNTAERSSEDVSKDIVREIRRRADLLHQDLSSSIEAFVASYESRERQLALRLATS